MPDFNINNSWGQKIGSIEQKGPGFLDSLSQIQQMRKMIQSEERVIFINSIYQLLDALSNQIQEMTELPKHINIHGELNRQISQSWLDWDDAVKKAPDAFQHRKLQNYVEKVLWPHAQQIRSSVDELYPFLLVFGQLNLLLSLMSEYFEFHNESCDRVEAQGLYEIEITDKVFIALNEKWGQAMDKLLEFHTETAGVASLLDGDKEFDSIYRDAQQLFDRLPELQEQIDNLVILTNGREKAAERVLAQHGSNKSSSSLTDELQKLVEMKNAGHLTEEEFLTAKGKLLS